jgi:ABC-type transport system substrate-binding protein
VAAVTARAPRQETVVIVGAGTSLSDSTLPRNSAVNRRSVTCCSSSHGWGGNITSGDKGFVPQLARSWTRRDSLTLVFEMDPRARWQDGTPVTARDAALAINMARDPAVDAQSALLLRLVAEATAPDDSHLVVRFIDAYDEQLYDAVYHVYPLPAHLVDTIPGALSNRRSPPPRSGAARTAGRAASRSSSSSSPHTINFSWASRAPAGCCT